jgi:hypothetical protein
MNSEVRHIAESVLWSVLELNKVEEISLELTVDEDQCCGYGNGLEANFSFVPWVKAPLLYEPVINNILCQRYSSVDVRDLLLFITRECIKEEHKLEPYCKYDCKEELIVTFVDKRIWIGQADD